MIQHSRIPAIITLAAIAGIGAVVFANHRGVATADESELAALQAAVAQPDAKPAAWLTYATKLQALGRFSRAEIAYKSFLESDPYNRQARLQCAICVALAGSGDDFAEFMKGTILVDPKLAVDIFGRPEAAKYLGEERFKALQREAVGAVDGLNGSPSGDCRGERRGCGGIFRID